MDRASVTQVYTSILGICRPAIVLPSATGHAGPPSGCQNSRQGRHLVVDDEGQIVRALQYGSGRWAQVFMQCYRQRPMLE